MIESPKKPPSSPIAASDIGSGILFSHETSMDSNTEVKCTNEAQCSTLTVPPAHCIGRSSIDEGDNNTTITRLHALSTDSMSDSNITNQFIGHEKMNMEVAAVEHSHQGSENRSNTRKLDDLKSYIEANLTTSRRAYHQDLLFGMILHVGKVKINKKGQDENNTLVNMLMKCRTNRTNNQRVKRKVNSSFEISKATKKARNVSGVNQTFLQSTTLMRDSKWREQQFRKPSYLAQLPRVLKTAFPNMNFIPSDKSDNAPIQIVDESYRRPGVAWRNLEELQNVVSSNFLSSAIGRNAFLTENPSIQALQSELKSNRNEVSKKKSSTSRFTPFTLVYNECSLSALANWSTQSMDERPTRKHSSQNIPVASPMFRLCSVCNKFGHYEIECKELVMSKESENIKRLAHHISVQRALRNFQEEYIEDVEDHEKPLEVEATAFMACEKCGSAHSGDALLLCDGCDRLYHTTCLTPALREVPYGDWFCSRCEGYNSDVSSVIEIEGFEGFVFEQQKRKAVHPADESLLIWNRGFDFTENGWYSAVAVVKDSQNSHCSDEEHDLKPEVEPALAAGEICWARRQQASAGKLGRDQWWPAVIVSVIRDMTHLGNLSPYLVRLIGVQNANRVRASSVHPFFSHFKKFGYEKLKAFKKDLPTNSPKALFQRAVWDAVTGMGFKSLTEALKKSQEELISSSGLPMRQQITPPQWKNADEDDVNGILIFSKQRESEALLEVDPLITQATSTAAHQIMSIKESLKYARLPGSTVAWFPHHLGPSTTEATDVMHVGTVLATDNERRRALLRPIVNWKEILLEDGMCDAMHDDADVLCLKSSPAASLLWIDMEDLHIVSNGPTDGSRSTVVKEVLPKHLHLTRQLNETMLQNKKRQTGAIQERVLESPCERAHVPELKEVTPAEFHAQAVKLLVEPDITHEAMVKELDENMNVLATFPSPTLNILSDTSDEILNIRIPSPEMISLIEPVNKSEQVPTPEHDPAPLPVLPLPQSLGDSPLLEPTPNLTESPESVSDAVHFDPESEAKVDDCASNLLPPKRMIDDDDDGIDDDPTETAKSEEKINEDDQMKCCESITKENSDINKLDASEFDDEKDDKVLVDDMEVKEGRNEDEDSFVSEILESAMIEENDNDEGEQVTPEIEMTLRSQGIYQVEEILDERRGNGGREYFIRWRGFTVEDCTWEPERNILNPNFVRKYEIDRVTEKMVVTEDAKINSSVTSRVVAALGVGAGILRTIPPGRVKRLETKRRLCPFCSIVFQDRLAFMGHVKIHNSQRNYEIIREAARLVNVEWYEEFDKKYTINVT